MSSYDSTNLRVTDLKAGFLFDYDLQNWEVKEEYEYDWGNDFYTQEYKVNCGADEGFLSVEVDDEIELAFFRKVSVVAIDPELTRKVVENEEPPRTIEYKGTTYHRTEESLGHWRNVKTSNWEQLITWDYEDESGSKYLTIERWGEEEIEVSVGHEVKEYQISNILPREEVPERAPRDIEDVKSKNKSKGCFVLVLIGLIFMVFGMARCSSSDSSYKKNPVDKLVTELMDNYTFSVILSDMDMQTSGWDSDFMHKYKVVYQQDSSSTPEKFETEWEQVSKDYFKKHESDLGMELVSKGPDGKINRSVSPAGYGAYVGNSKYGEWKTNESGQSFWSFYGKYMFMQSMFGMFWGGPVYRSYYSDWRGNYYGSRPYYGPRGNSYGTNSRNMQKTRPDFYQRRKQKNGFSARSGRRSRSSSRYGGSSYRSRGGGFGK